MHDKFRVCTTLESKSAVTTEHWELQGGRRAGPPLRFGVENSLKSGILFGNSFRIAYKSKVID